MGFNLFKIFSRNKENILKNGDRVEYLSENKHNSGSPTAYGGFTGTCIGLNDKTGTFFIKGETSTLVVSGNRRRYIWLKINGKRLKHQINVQK